MRFEYKNNIDKNIVLSNIKDAIKNQKLEKITLMILKGMGLNYKYIDCQIKKAPISGSFTF